MAWTSTPRPATGCGREERKEGRAMEDRDFVAAFEAGTLPNEAFHHRDHVRLAWLYLRELPPAQALTRFTEGLRRFAAVHGKPGLYHETITWAYLLLI